MHAPDLPAKNRDPVFRIAESKSIAHIEIDADRFAAELGDEALHFKRAEQELIPYIFNANSNAAFLRGRQCLVNKLRGALPSRVVGHDLAAGDEIRADRGRKDKNGV